MIGNLKTALLGGLLLVVGIALRVVSHAHVPFAANSAECTNAFGTHPATTERACTASNGVWTAGSSASGWSPTVYNLAHVIFWALVVFGVIVVAFALVCEVKTRPNPVG